MKNIIIISSIAVALTACSPTNEVGLADAKRTAAFSAQLVGASTASLCATYISAATSYRSKMMVEAELGARGVAHCSRNHVGALSVAQLNRNTYSRSQNTQVTSDRDCGDFSSSAQAQRFFLAAGGPANDPHNLDGDGDGLACEWGAAATRLYRKALPVVRRAAPRQVSSSRCYVGPRGGTYTITASGNKNYSGC